MTCEHGVRNEANCVYCRSAKKAKHTPGPWEIDGDGDGNSLSIFPGPTSKISSRIAVVEEDIKQGIANARLIAAAPEMLEKLHDAANTLREEIGEWLPVAHSECPERIENLKTVLGEIEIVIAKAERCSSEDDSCHEPGQAGNCPDCHDDEDDTEE